MLWIQRRGAETAWQDHVQIGTFSDTKGRDQGIGSNTITPLRVLNRNSSNHEILGLLTQPGRRAGRREAKSEARDSNAQDCAALRDATGLQTRS